MLCLVTRTESFFSSWVKELTQIRESRRGGEEDEGSSKGCVLSGEDPGRDPLVSHVLLLGTQAPVDLHCFHEAISHLEHA